MGLLPGNVHLFTLGQFFAQQTKTRKFACCTGNSFGEGECSGTTGNWNGGVPVVLKSCLLVLRGENKHFRVFRVHMKLRAALITGLFP